MTQEGCLFIIKKKKYVNIMLEFYLGSGSGGLDLLVEGPSEASVTCKNNNDGTCTVQYVPYGPGDYDVSIKFSNQHIPGSPFSVSHIIGSSKGETIKSHFDTFQVPVVMGVDADAVKVYGPGIEPSKCRSGIPVSFTVDASESANAELGVKLTTDRGNVIDSHIW